MSIGTQEEMKGFVKVFDEYVFGIVVDEWMKELILASVPTHIPEIAKQPLVILKPKKNKSSRAV